MDDLKGKVALVAGASRAAGRPRRDGVRDRADHESGTLRNEPPGNNRGDGGPGNGGGRAGNSGPSRSPGPTPGEVPDRENRRRTRPPGCSGKRHRGRRRVLDVRKENVGTL